MSSRLVMGATRTTRPLEHHTGVVSERVLLHIDGLPFSAYRFAPASGAIHSVPTILASSYGCNHALFRAGVGGASLVEQLCAAGHVAWAFDLRGQEATYDAAARAHLRNGHGTPTLGDFAAMELATVVQRALAETSATQVNLIGLSMGGVIGAAYAAMVAPAQVRRLAMVGSPLHWQRVPWWAYLLSRSPRAVTALPTAQWHRVVHHAAPHTHWVPQRLLPRWLAGADASAHLALGALVGPLAPAINHAAAAWVRDGVMLGERALWDHLPNIGSPVLCAYSPADRFAPGDNVEPALDRLGTPRRQQQRIVVRDATHTELMVGRWATRELYPRLVKFIGE